VQPGATRAGACGRLAGVAGNPNQAPSLYRRHRPRTFDDVVGQEHVVRTLRNAVEQDKVHHAYLFVGSRGTGKTSMAKILAACLNCAGPPGRPRSGPTTDPCGVCDSCVAIATASSLDVIEMDAASNNSVDDVRDLREKVAFAPVSGRHKVYILDEAHMLSTAAWNAFLKTLEEPPPHTIFVLATTEANKVPATVVDRCHRFDFARPTTEQLAAVVQRVAQSEGIEIPADAVALLARYATGSFRDALGTLEQLVTYSGPRIALSDVLGVLGVADADLLFGALDAVAAGSPRDALLVVAGVAESGRDLSRFTSDLEAHARELLVVQTLGEVPRQIAITPERDARLADQARRVPADAVVRLLDLLAAGMRAVRDGADPRTQVELALVKAAAPEVDPSTRALLARIERLERTLGGEEGATAPAAPSAGPKKERPRQPPAQDGSPSPAPAEAERPGNGHAAAAPSSGAVAVAVAAPAPRAAAELDIFVELWPAILSSLSETNQVLALCLADARPVAVEGHDLIIAFDRTSAFMRRKAEDAPNRAALGEAIRALTGIHLGLVFELRDAVAAPPGDAAGAPVSDDDLIARFKAEFDAEEIDPAEREEPS
jgi:DNA polymerase-3 subunit gamma/tau